MVREQNNTHTYPIHVPTHAPPHTQPFEDDEYDSGYREAENYNATLVRQSSSITDVKSAADASSRAAVAASAAAAAVAVTKVGGWGGVCVLRTVRAWGVGGWGVKGNGSTWSCYML